MQMLPANDNDEHDIGYGNRAMTYILMHVSTFYFLETIVNMSITAFLYSSLSNTFRWKTFIYMTFTQTKTSNWSNS